jgi:hypothetical protein
MNALLKGMAKLFSFYIIHERITKKIDHHHGGADRRVQRHGLVIIASSFCQPLCDGLVEGTVKEFYSNM